MSRSLRVPPQSAAHPAAAYPRASRSHVPQINAARSEVLSCVISKGMQVGRRPVFLGDGSNRRLPSTTLSNAQCRAVLVSLEQRTDVTAVASQLLRLAARLWPAPPQPGQRGGTVRQPMQRWTPRLSAVRLIQAKPAAAADITLYTFANVNRHAPAY